MKFPPAVVLFFLAPAVAELLSGSAPPTEFFNPISLLLLASLYGSGALIIRELKVRWNKGYVTMFVLGAAYGMIEEGLMVKSFFDPEWMDLGILGVYGRWLEINWVWAEWLTIYHAIFSIAIPITLVELTYMEKRDVSWIGNKKLAGLIMLLGAVTAFGYIFLTDYRPPLPQYLFTGATVIALVVLARKIPSNAGKGGKLKASRPSRLALIGFLATSAFFLLFMAGPYVFSQPLILMILGLALISTIFCFLRRYEWTEGTLFNKFTLSAGAIAFLAVLTPLQELNNARGMSIVGITAIVMLLFLKKRLKTRKEVATKRTLYT